MIRGTQVKEMQKNGTGGGIEDSASVQEVNFTLSSRIWIYRRDVNITGRGWNDDDTFPSSLDTIYPHHADVAATKASQHFSLLPVVMMA